MIEQRFVSAQEVEDQRRAKFEQHKLSVRNHEDVLAGYIRSLWTKARDYRTPYTKRFQDCLERRSGIYSPEMQSKIKQAGEAPLYMRLTSAKCKAAKTWISDLFEPAGDRPFTLKAANTPDLNPEIKMKLLDAAIMTVMQTELTEDQAIKMVEQREKELLDELVGEANIIAEKMGDRVEDILAAAGWADEFDNFVDDLVTYPVAVMAGLDYRQEKELGWAQDEDGKWVPKYQNKIVPKVRRVSPFRFYPLPGVTNTLRGYGACEHITYTRTDLMGMRDMPGYNRRGIVMALNQYQVGGLREWLWEDNEQDILNYSQYDQQQDTIDAVKYAGSISGHRLVQFGLSGVKDSEEYQAEIEIIGGFVIRAVVSPDPDSSPNYYFAHWSSVPGSFYGDALPELMNDCQDMCNAAARSLNANMAMSSGPMVWIDASKLHSADVPYAHVIEARKVWRAYPDPDQAITNANAAIQFFQPSSNAHELMTIYEKFSSIADDVTGLPKFAYGSDKGAGAARTAQGLSMLMNASSKTIKHPIRSIDLNLIAPLVKKIYDHEMMYGEDDSIKGDLKVKARGSQSLIHKEQMMLRQQELLGITGNPIDMQIMGLEGRSELLRNVFKSGEIPVDRIIPSKEKIQQNMEKAAALEQQQQMLGQQPQQPQNQPSAQAIAA